MRRGCWIWGVVILGMVGSGRAEAQDGVFQGVWRTSIGTVTLAQKGDEVTGTYGNDNQFTIRGRAKGKILTYEFTEGDAKGDATWFLNETGLSFMGGFQVRGGRASGWSGWRPDPEASRGEPRDFTGSWITPFGLMELKQEGTKVSGRYAVRGGSEIEGDVSGRHLEFRYKGFFQGKGWFDLSPDGKKISGAALDDGAFAWFGWYGRSAPEFVRDAPLKGGQILDGSTQNLMTYAVRAPDGYDPKDGKKWPAVVILHGANTNGRSYVETIASAWPDIARDFLLIGINGDLLPAAGPVLLFNFNFPNFVGKSIHKGNPGNDRESPALVAEALDELRAKYPVSKFLVGGHSESGLLVNEYSQGGSLVYSLLMNYPDKIAGAFPISSVLPLRCAPSDYADEALKRLQGSRPLAIVHGKDDPVIKFPIGQHAADAFRESGRPAFRFFDPDQGGHKIGLLPVDEAIRWLDVLTTDDHARLVEFAEASLRDGHYRDAIAAIDQSGRFEPLPDLDRREGKVREAIDAQAGPKARDFLEKIKGGQAGWIDDFLAFRDQFEFAEASKDVMAAFNDLRASQTAPAQALMNEALTFLHDRKAEEAVKRCRQIVDQYPASPLYRTARRALPDRK